MLSCVQLCVCVCVSVCPPALCSPMDCSFPGSSVHGILPDKSTGVGSHFPGFPGGAMVKKLHANAGDTGDVDSVPGSGRSPGEGKWQHSPVFLPGKIPWAEEPSGLLQPLGLQRVGHDLSTHTHHLLFQRIFPTQGSNPRLHWQVDALPPRYLGTLCNERVSFKFVRVRVLTSSPELYFLFSFFFFSPLLSVAVKLIWNVNLVLSSPHLKVFRIYAVYYCSVSQLWCHSPFAM